ncbi:MAG: hypothetical protein FJY88_13740, partial [Candidatus Eisenbacteria bacterium]|nr:hypothetical protein [Candidatus Eisenbacteria bacterium]
DVLFVDEIHGLDEPCQDYLLTALAGGRVNVLISHGSKTHTVSVVLEPFTFIGATTDPQHLKTPFIDRFGNRHDLEPYAVEETAEIIASAAERTGLRIDREAVHELARRSRENPREALQLLDAARILAQAGEIEEITRECAARAAQYLGVDEDGLRPAERRILTFLAGRDGPVSLRTIADTLNLDQETVRAVHEPYLIRAGFILRTMHGRMATAKARARFGGPASPVAVASAREKVSGEKAELADRSARAALTPSARDREVGSRPHSESKPREQQATRRRIAYPLRIIVAVVAIVMAAGACEPEDDCRLDLGPAAAVRALPEPEGLAGPDRSKWQREAQVRRELRSAFFPIRLAVRGILADTIRVRSFVEKIKSRLRPYVYLELLRLFFDHRRFMRSERAERAGKSGPAPPAGAVRVRASPTLRLSPLICSVWMIGAVAQHCPPIGTVYDPLRPPCPPGYPATRSECCLKNSRPESWPTDRTRRVSLPASRREDDEGISDLARRAIPEDPRSRRDRRAVRES